MKFELTGSASRWKILPDFKSSILDFSIGVLFDCLFFDSDEYSAL